jgi:hypothetical protein
MPLQSIKDTTINLKKFPAKNKEEMIKEISTDENEVNNFEQFTKKKVDYITSIFAAIMSSNENEGKQQTAQSGKGIKKLNKQQKKNIILGEIKAGNNNPLLIKFFKKI